MYKIDISELNNRGRFACLFPSQNLENIRGMKPEPWLFFRDWLEGQFEKIVRKRKEIYERIQHPTFATI